jgi:hypothetical protein
MDIVAIPGFMHEGCQGPGAATGRASAGSDADIVPTGGPRRRRAATRYVSL